MPITARTSKVDASPRPIWITVRRTESDYGLSVRTQYRLIAAGRLKSTTVGRRRLNSVDSIEQILASGE
jgi:hypothetical protein